MHNLVFTPAAIRFIAWLGLIGPAPTDSRNMAPQGANDPTVTTAPSWESKC
jgi:hypothetical protein